MSTADQNRQREMLHKQREMLHKRGICVVIPTYNNDGTIGRVVEETLAECDDVIVVNDGSTDTTASILSVIEGITLVTLPKNSGKGAALKAGFRKALDMGFAYAITLDGDGQHYPKEITKFLEANKEHPGTLIVGSRNPEGIDRSKGSNFANQFSNFWFWLQTGRRLSDTQTGYRLYPLRKLHGLCLLTSRYEAELELLVFSSWHGTDIFEIPIDVYYPPQEERVSHFRPGMDFARISILNTVLCVLAIVYGLPLRLWRWVMKYVRTIYALLFFLFFMFVVIKPAVWVYLKVGKMVYGSQFTVYRKSRKLHKLMYRVSRFVMLTHGIPGVKFSYGVKDGVKFDRPRVVICNHQSHLDLFCQLIFTPDIVFLTNDWVWNNPSYGLLIRHAEYYPVREGIEELLPKLKSLVERGYSIAVYPEGTRSKDCQIGRFHQGAFWLADQLGVDILPMCLYGPGKILKKKTYTLQKGPVRIEVGEPVSLETLHAMGELMMQTKEMRRRYQEWYESMANEIEKSI
jgi:1-acyl-sn-glycerol-3-phosphate acyltransferase